MAQEKLEMSATIAQVAESASRVQAFREDGTFGLPLSLTPGRHRPRHAYRPAKASENLLEFLKRRQIPEASAWDRGRELVLLGDPLADDYAALYPKLGHEKARRLLDAALEHGIEHVVD